MDSDGDGDGEREWRVSEAVDALREAREKTMTDLMTGILYANHLMTKKPPEVPEDQADDADGPAADEGNVELGEVAVAFNLLASNFPVSQEHLPPIVLRSQLYAHVPDKTLVDRELVCSLSYFLCKVILVICICCFDDVMVMNS